MQTAEVKVVHQGAELVFGLNATPDKTRHSVTVRRGQDSGPDVIHIQTNGVYHGVVDEVVETRGRLTCVRVRYACIGVATFTGGVVSPGAPLVDRGLRPGLCRIAPRQSD